MEDAKPDGSSSPVPKPRKKRVSMAQSGAGNEPDFASPPLPHLHQKGPPKTEPTPETGPKNVQSKGMRCVSVVGSGVVWHGCNADQHRAQNVISSECNDLCTEKSARVEVSRISLCDGNAVKCPSLGDVARCSMQHDARSLAIQSPPGHYPSDRTICTKQLLLPAVDEGNDDKVLGAVKPPLLQSKTKMAAREKSTPHPSEATKSASLKPELPSKDHIHVRLMKEELRRRKSEPAKDDNVPEDNDSTTDVGRSVVQNASDSETSSSGNRDPNFKHEKKKSDSISSVEAWKGKPAPRVKQFSPEKPQRTKLCAKTEEGGDGWEKRESTIRLGSSEVRVVSDEPPFVQRIWGTAATAGESCHNGTSGHVDAELADFDPKERHPISNLAASDIGSTSLISSGTLGTLSTSDLPDKPSSLYSPSQPGNASDTFSVSATSGRSTPSTTSDTSVKQDLEAVNIHTTTTQAKHSGTEKTHGQNKGVLSYHLMHNRTLLIWSIVMWQID